jgi:hypothetical protein
MMVGFTNVVATAVRKLYAQDLNYAIVPDIVVVSPISSKNQLNHTVLMTKVLSIENMPFIEEVLKKGG